MVSLPGEFGSVVQLLVAECSADVSAVPLLISSSCGALRLAVAFTGFGHRVKDWTTIANSAPVSAPTV
jgi:hypothetical protein